MQQIDLPSKEQWTDLVVRPTFSLLEAADRVGPIVEAVKHNGDAALLNFTKQFDGAELDSLAVERAVLNAAQVSTELDAAIQLACANVERFHAEQARSVKEVETAPGVRCWREVRPIDAVGLYIPGGTAPLLSTIIMLAVPARLAGCKQIILCTPPKTDGTVNEALLYTARVCGVTSIFRVGGAQAIAALAFGTQTVPKVQKIFGPGNQYVTAAKQLVSQGGTAIDLPAGPTELLIIADHSANPEFVAADILSQAEHGLDSQVIVAFTDRELRTAVMSALEVQRQALPREEFVTGSLANSRAILFSDLSEAAEFSNLYAPEHLILAVESPRDLLPKISAAGSIFLGHLSPESAGDYASGTNHVLPTSGCAGAWSGVSLESFQKFITCQELNERGLQSIGPAVIALAEAEGLSGHAAAVRVRNGDRQE